MIKAVFNWSGGKDSALALWKIIQSKQYEVIALLTTINRHSRRSTMHDIPIEILQQQADSIGIPLYVVDLTPKGNMEDYNQAMSHAVCYFKKLKVTHFIFGDIFLHDVKSYREQQLLPWDIQVVEPLWNKTSNEIMDEFLRSGLQTVIVTTTATQLGKEYIGKTIDSTLITSLPAEIDVCGENGEYHTLCYDGPLFQKNIHFQLGEPYKKEFPIKLDDGTEQLFSYWFADIKAL